MSVRSGRSLDRVETPGEACDRCPRSHYRRIDFATTAFSADSRNVALMASPLSRCARGHQSLSRGKRINNSAISFPFFSFPRDFFLSVRAQLTRARARVTKHTLFRRGRLPQAQRGDGGGNSSRRRLCNAVRSLHTTDCRPFGQPLPTP